MAMPPAAAANTYTDLNGLAALKRAPDSPAARQALAEQVEALFLQMMLKSMRDAGMAEDAAQSNEKSMYEDMFDKQVALSLSKHQDLGIGRLFERELPRSASPAPAGPPRPISPPVAPAAPAPQHPGPGSAGRGAPGSASSLAEAVHFVAAVLPPIRRAAQVLGVNPLGLLAQAALETGWGQRMARTADGSPSLNLFGIKAGEGWQGARAVADSVEFVGGVAMPRRSAFRAYRSIEESVADFAQLLKDSPRYREAIAAGGDAQGYIEGIARSGYASDPDYGNKLNQVLNGGTLRAALTVRLAAL